MTDLQLTACVFRWSYAFRLIVEGLTAFRFSGIFFLRLITVFLLQCFEVNYPILNHVANDDNGGTCVKMFHQTDVATEKSGVATANQP